MIELTYAFRKGVEMAKIRKLVGVCLQQDLHYPDLTVEEHMQFFGQLRVITQDLNRELSCVLSRNFFYLCDAD